MESAHLKTFRRPLGGNNMKKVLAIFLTLVMSFSVLAACGPGERTKKETGETADGKIPAKPEKLVIWEDIDKSVGLVEALESFEAEYGIKVEFKELNMADKIRDQLRLDGPAGTGPDVVTLPHDQIGQVVTEGLIKPITVSDDVLSIFSESSVQAQTYDGKLYGLPKATETTVFIYNKDLLPEPPKSLDDLYEFSKNYGGEKEYGFLALWDNFYFAHGVLGGMGGYVFDTKDGNVDPSSLGLNNEGAIAGAEYIQKWYKNIFPKGIIGDNGYSTMDGLFAKEKVASIMNGPWSFAGYKEKGINLGIAPMPLLPNGEHPQTYMGVKGWHVTSFTKHDYWATKLVEWITNEENAKIRYEKTAEIPPVKALVNTVLANDEGAKAVAIQSQYAVPMPNIPEMSEVWGPMATALQLVATQKETPKDALKEAVKSITTNIETKHSGN
jgi:arabinogalactan oligomer / maltooligosaccharide transport system substrate-binding protein